MLIGKSENIECFNCMLNIHIYISIVNYFLLY